MSMAPKSMRNELGNFASVVCMKSIVTGVEEALGEKAAAIAMISAGRQRGKNLAEELDLVDKGSGISLEDLTAKMNQTIGKDGTRLCIVDKITQDGDGYTFYIRESVCSFGEPEGSSRNCTYTLGALQGFLEALLGKRMRGKQLESVLRGGEHDVLEFSVLT